MLNLNEHNRQNDFRPPTLNAGVTCDKCSAEMVYSGPGIMLSLPPKRNVHCPKCGYKGHKIIPFKE